LIQAALDLSGTQGLAATSVRAVLCRAGLQDRSFGESFASMEELLAAVHDHLHDAEFPRAVAAMDPAAPPVEQVVEGDVIEHRVELSLFPNWVGTTVARSASIDGRVLTLTPVVPIVVNGMARGVVLEWERV
jgi:AcrR family transcriptional regulator